jgi:hypothetical protein
MTGWRVIALCGFYALLGALAAVVAAALLVSSVDAAAPKPKLPKTKRPTRKPPSNHGAMQPRQYARLHFHSIGWAPARHCFSDGRLSVGRLFHNGGPGPALRIMR